MKPKFSNKFLGAIVAAAALVFTASHSHAAALTWDADLGTAGAQDGSGISWTTGSGNWRNTTTATDNVNWTAGDSATFGAGTDGTYAITVGGAISVSTISFLNDGYTLSSGTARTITPTSATNTITVASTKSATIGSNVTVTKAGALVIESGGTLNVTGAGAILQSTSGTLSVNGGSKLFVGTGGVVRNSTSIVIGATNTANNALEVNGGTLEILSTATAGSNLVLANNAAGGSATITLTSGDIKNSKTDGTLRFGLAGANSASSTLHLNGGTLTVAKIIEGNTGHSSTFNFNGGTLKVLTGAADAANFMTGIDTANVRDFGAIIDTNNVATTIGQNLVHSGIGFDNPTDGGLTKNGSGTLTLTGTNTYNGATTISAGTISAAKIVVSGGDSSLGNAASAVTLGSAGAQGTLSYSGASVTYTRGLTIGGAGGGRLDVTTSGQILSVDTGAITGSGLFTVGGAGRTTINAAITHTGGLTKASGSGSLFLTNGANTYNGVTDITGALIVTANGALGTTAGGTTVNASSALGLSGGIDYTTTETVTGSGLGSPAIAGITPAVSRGFIQSTVGNNTFRGNITVGSGISRIGTQDGASLTLTGTINQASGTLLFRVGNTAGDYVTLSNSGNSFAANPTVFSGATAGLYAGVRLGVDDALPTTLAIFGETGTGAGTALDLNGFNQRLNGLTGGQALNIINSNTSTASTLTVENLLDRSTTGTLIRGGVGLGTINVVKDGAFSQTLSGTHDYTGTTAVNGGTLLINGNVSTSNFTVGSTATLGGTGTIGGTVTVNNGGSLSSGASIESLATGALTLNNGSIFDYEMSNDAPAITAGDLTAVTGNLTLNLANLAVLTLTDEGVGSWTVGEKLTLISYSGIWNGGLFTYGLGSLADESTFTFSGMSWLFDYDDNANGTNYVGDLTGSSFVTMTAVPEPNVAALLGGLGVLALLRRRR